LKKSVVVVAGGIGSRMKAELPKQFLLLAGKPMLMHSMLSFVQTYPDIFLFLVLPAEQFGPWNELCHKFSFFIPHQLIGGGETRFHSVKNAMAVIPDDGLVAVHDGARPLVTPSLIRSVFETADRKGNCIPVIPVNESIRMISGPTSRPVNREEFALVQTPQVFSSSVIKKAYLRPYSEKFTDDATVAEAYGEQIYLIEGERSNIKITLPADLDIAEALIPR